MIFYGAVRLGTAYNLFVRRVVPTLLLLAVAATLHASVPTVQQPRFNQAPASARLQSPAGVHTLPITAAPADRRSFFAEFYSPSVPGKTSQRKSGLLRRFTTAVKKTAQKINFFD